MRAMDKASKKEMRAQYNERKVIGGVYAVRNTLNNKLFLDVSTDLRGSKNRFDFAVTTGSCVYLKLQNDWTEQGGNQFVIEVLEELEKGEGQSSPEFKDELELLKQMWLEKLSGEVFY